MKHIGKIILVALMALMPLSSFAGHEAGSSGEMNISETVLEHLSDSYALSVVARQESGRSARRIHCQLTSTSMPLITEKSTSVCLTVL